MLNELYDLFQNMTKSFETLYVLEGVKPVARMSFFENSVSRVEDFCKANNLSFVTSDYKVLMNFNGNYSTKGKKISIDSPIRGYIFMYLSKSKDKARKAREMEYKNDYYKFGKLLGYPKCCRKFFVEYKSKEVQRVNDYVMPAIKNSKNHLFDFHNNIFGRYFDVTLLSHCPCSFDCKKSILLAKKHLKIINKYDRDIALQVRDLLSSAVIYNANGVFILTDHEVNGKKISYKEVMATNPNQFYDILNREKSLTMLKRNHFKVGNRKFNFPLLIFK